MKVALRSIESVIPYERNPRRPKKAVAKVRASIEAFGFRQPIVVDEAGVVIVGHTRLLAAREMGLERVPVHVAEGLSPEKVRAYRLADNRTGEEAEWDEALLALELKDLGAAPAELEATGFEDAEIRKLLAGITTETEEDPPAPEPPGNPETRPGDLIELGPHRLLCGDSTKWDDVDGRLLEGTRMACVFTDPPYAIYGSSTGIAADITDDKMVRPFFRDVVVHTVRSLRPFGHAYICCDWRSYPSWWEVAKGTGLVIKNMIVWDKMGAGLGSNYANTHELLAFGSHVPLRGRMTQKIKGIRTVNAPNVWRMKRVAAAGATNGREHNAQKPVELVRTALGHSSGQGDPVLDFFGGSGTTLIAAEELGRTCYMLEITPGYCDVIVARWERLTGKTARRPSRRARSRR